MAEKIILGGINIQALLNTKYNFDNNLDKVKDDLDRAGIIQYFEFCFELSWKTLKKILNYKGEIVSNLGPRDLFRISAKYNLIRDPELWFGFLEDRNLSSHTYKEATAQYVYSQLGSFKLELDDLVNKILQL